MSFILVLVYVTFYHHRHHHDTNNMAQRSTLGVSSRTWAWVENVWWYKGAHIIASRLVQRKPPRVKQLHILRRRLHRRRWQEHRRACQHIPPGTQCLRATDTWYRSTIEVRPCNISQSFVRTARSTLLQPIPTTQSLFVQTQLARAVA